MAQINSGVNEVNTSTAYSRMVGWLLLNGGMVACAIYGLFLHVDQAKNVLLFMVWSATVLTTFGGLHKETRLKLIEKGPSAPLWLTIGSDLIIMFALASVGRFFSAAAMLWIISIEAGIYTTED